MTIRCMVRHDMPKILAIEQQSFNFAWKEKDFLKCLKSRNCLGMIIEHGDDVIGFMIFELHKAKLHLINFAVHPQHRRQGLGSKMISRMIEKLSANRRTKISLEVRETNLAAQIFFKSQGFKATKVLRRFYEDSGEDAFCMQYSLTEAANAECAGVS